MSGEVPAAAGSLGGRKEPRVKYLNGLSWGGIMREERVFCAELYFQARSDPDRFAALLRREVKLNLSTGQWEVAFEACFYRDWCHKVDPKRKREFPMKRTFDLLLLGGSEVVVIEAKLAETFLSAQTKNFARDRELLRQLVGSTVRVFLVALGTRTYFDNHTRIGHLTTLEPFDGRLTWESICQEYPDVPLFARACLVYERSLLAEREAIDGISIE